MKAMCLNCKYYDAVLYPYCNWLRGITNPESICAQWTSNRAKGAKEDEHDN